VRIVYFGTANFAVPALEALAPHIAGVVTQPDKPSGRGMDLRASPVARVAADLGLFVLKPDRCRDIEFLAAIEVLEPDVLVVAAYGQILPQRLLDIPPWGGINIHGSLLPRWRGAAPIQRAIQHGDAVTGVTIMQMDKGMDTGDILMWQETSIGSDETAGELFGRLASMGAEMILDVLDRYRDLPHLPQDDALATVASKFTRGECRIDWSAPAQDAYNLYRAVTPFPGAFTLFGGKMMKLLRVRPASDSGVPGQVLAVTQDGIVVACGHGALRLEEVQPEGKPRMSAHAFAIGHDVKAGCAFDPLTS